MDFEDEQTTPTNSELELTPELAQEIFGADGTPREIFVNPEYDYSWRHIKKGYQHGKWLRKIMRKAMSGNYLISEAEYDEEGNLVTPAEYFSPTTASAFVTFMNGVYADKADELNELVLLDVQAVGLDLMNGLSWAEWKASFGGN